MSSQNPPLPPELNDDSQNPPLPPELNDYLLFPDKVGDTLLSKQWAIKSIMKTIEWVDNEPAPKEGDDKIELETSIEDRLSVIWDFSSSEEVAHYLGELNIFDVFSRVIEKTNSPRLVELALGIFSNVVLVSPLCQNFVSNYLNDILPLAGSSDSAIALQAVRIVTICLHNEDASCGTLEALENCQEFKKSILFIFGNCLNIELLASTLQMLIKIWDLDDAQIPKWADSNMVNALVKDAGRHLCTEKDYQKLEDLFYLIHLLSTDETGLAHLVPFFDGFQELAKDYIDNYLDDEAVLPSENEKQTLTILFTTFRFVIEAAQNKEINIRTDLLKNWSHRLLSCVEDNLADPESNQNNLPYKNSLENVRNLVSNFQNY